MVKSGDLGVEKRKEEERRKEKKKGKEKRRKKRDEGPRTRQSGLHGKSTVKVTNFSLIFLSLLLYRRP